MNGVEILFTEQVVSESAFNTTAFLTALVASLVILTLIGIVGYKCGFDDWTIIPFCIVVGIVVGLFIGFVLGRAFETPTAYETHYKVTIDDSVSMNEFNEKYEILDQEGKIYTVKERE